MIVHVEVMENQVIEVANAIEFPAGEREVHLDPVIPVALGGLHVPAHHRAMRADILQVESGGDHLDVVKGELRPLRDDLPVASDHGAAVVVQAISVAPLLVGVEVDSTKLERYL